MRKRFATPSGFRRTARLAAAILAIVLAAPLGAAADDVVINKTLTQDDFGSPYVYGYNATYEEANVSGDSVTFHITAPAYSQDGSLDSSMAAFSAVTSYNGSSTASISGTNGVTITFPTNVNYDYFGYQQYQRGFGLAGDQGSWSVTSSDGDNVIVGYDTRPPSGRTGSGHYYNHLNYVYANGHTVTLTGRNNRIYFDPSFDGGTPFYDSYIRASEVRGLSAESQGFVNLNATDGDNVISLTSGGYYLTGGVIGLTRGSHLTLSAPQGANRITLAPYYGAQQVWGVGNYAYRNQNLDNPVPSEAQAAVINLTGRDNVIDVTGNGATSRLVAVGTRTLGVINVTASGGDNVFRLYGRGSSTAAAGIYAETQGRTTVTAESGNNAVTMDAGTIAPQVSGIRAVREGVVQVSAPQGDNVVTLVADADATARPLSDRNLTNPGIDASGVRADSSGTVTVSGRNNRITADVKNSSGTETKNGYGVSARTQGTVQVTASGTNQIYGSTTGVQASNGTARVTSTGGANIVTGGVQALSAEASSGGTARAIVTGTSRLATEGTDAIVSYAHNDETSDALAQVQYGSGSTITGDVLAYGKGNVDVRPAASGTVAITGNLKAFGEEPATDTEPAVRSGGSIAVDLTGGSTLTGTADTGLVADRSAYGTVDLQMQPGSTWFMTGHSAVTNLTGSDGTVWFQNGGDAVEADSVSGSHTWAVDLDYDTPANSDMIYIANGTSDEQTLNVKNIGTVNAQMPDGAKVRFATVKNAGGGFIEGKSYYAPNGIYNDALTVHYVDRATDTETKNYDGDGTDESRKPSQETVEEMYGGQNVYLVKKEKAELNEGALTPLRSEELVWRYMTDLDTFTNRTGESQYFTPGAGQGGWIRYKYRNLGVDGVGEVDGSTYELGYTAVTRQDDERKHRLGASVAYGKDTGRWEGYGGDLKLRDLALSFYDTHEYFPSQEKMAGKPAWKEGTHTYWDNYLKYHHVRTDYDACDPDSGAVYTGEYSQDVVKLSTEYGRENKLSEKWSWVPQAQLQLAYLSSYDYTDSRGLAVSAEHDWSLISRAGFDLVKNLDAKKESKLYLKASVLPEFFDGNDVTTSSGNDRYTSKGDQSGTWGVFGLGYSVKSGKNQYMYFDAERYVGNDFKRTYNLRAGLNWKL